MSQVLSTIRGNGSEPAGENRRFARRLLVITPTLGTSPYLDRVVDCISALGVECEHVLVAPLSSLPALQARFPNLTIVAEKMGAGMYGALNLGLQSARPGWNWFTYLNDDDLLSFDQSVVPALDDLPSTGAWAVYGRGLAINKDGQTIFRINVAQDVTALADLLQWGIVPLTQQGLIFSRGAWERLGAFDTTYTHGADLETIVRALNLMIPFHYVSDIVGSFRVHQGQLSKHAGQMRLDKERAIAGLRVGRRSLFSLAGYRLSGIPAMLQRVRKFGLKRVHEIYETQE